MKPDIRQKFVVGNWKMYTTAAGATQLAKAIVDGMGIMSGKDRVSVAVCPPFPYLAVVGEILKDSCVALGAQNLYPEKEGAFTGEVSPTMLIDLGCKYVILGHSERRHKLGESDAFISQKVNSSSDQRRQTWQEAQTEAVLDRQLVQGLVDVPADILTRVSIAYEPVWAIGNSGHQATPQQAQDAHGLIRRRFGQIYGEKSAQAVVIQYGGSVKPENAVSMLSPHGVDGALTGGASLHADQFLAIVQAGIGEAQVTGKSA